MAGSVTRFVIRPVQRGPTPTIIEITQPSASAKRLSIMAVQCGIVGLPNVGKSTLFNALTKAGIAAENYPFCTIEPNSGIVEVPDQRLNQLADIVKPQKVVPATVEFVDIAGLVKGASKGEGLGNQFLANIRTCDATAHVVRCFEDDNVVHVAGKVSPIDDIEVINTELALADLATVEKAILKYSKLARAGGDKEAQRMMGVLESARRCWTKARRCVQLTSTRKKSGAQTAHADHRETNDNMWPTWRTPTTLHTTSTIRPWLPTPPPKGAGRGRLRQHGNRDRRHGRRRQDGVLKDLGLERAGPEPRDPRGLRPARAADLLHGGREGSARLDHPQGRHGAAGRRRDPHRFRERLHPRPDHQLRRFHPVQGRTRRQRGWQDARRGQGNTWCRMATC